ncbi:MAG: methylenetetrahydrofolate reductase [Candidatus Thermoplasmatota archaeon]
MTQKNSRSGILKKVLENNNFAVTAEIGPPKGSDPNEIIKKAEKLRDSADCFNITDNQTAVVRMSSWAGCSILLKMNLEPIMQITCRDRNRIAIQSDILGAAAIGIKNVLLITGDHQSFGNHPQSKGVYDLDSIQTIKIAREMRDKGIFQSGDRILSTPPDIFIGGVANPFADPVDYRVDRLEKKIKAGVDFIQTQSVYNIEKFKKWMREVNQRGLDKKVHILAGITPLKSKYMAKRMKFDIPGVDIPNQIYDKIQKSDNVKKTGYELSVKIIDEIKKIEGIHGIHITALFWEEIISKIVRKAKLLPRF